MQYGLIIPTEGQPIATTPADGVKFTYDEMSKAVEGMIEVYDIGEYGEFTFYLNEEGKMYDMPDNPLATAILKRWCAGSVFDVTGERVVGPVLIIGPRPYEVTEQPA